MRETIFDPPRFYEHPHSSILILQHCPHLPPTLKSLIEVIKCHPNKIKDHATSKLLHLSSGTSMNIHLILKEQKKALSLTQVMMGLNLTNTLVDPLQEEDPQMTPMMIPTKEILTANHPSNHPTLPRGLPGSPPRGPPG
jgi:hypothetical protein